MRVTQWMLCTAVLLTAACSEQRSPTAIADESEVRVLGQDLEARRAHMERLARRVALAMADPAFRAYVRTAIDRSPYTERKLPFSRFTEAEGARAAAAMARADSSTPAAVAADLDSAGKLEFYLPVPAHRAAWRGDADILVATEVVDHEAPVAYTARGERVVLDPRTPPTTPVLAVVPQETDFDAPQAAMMICDTCDTSNTGSYQPPPSGVTSLPALHMTYFNVNKDFEGWLKGAPEYEIHVMGPATSTDTSHYRSLYCIGEHARTYWNNDNDSWSGDVVLMSADEMAAFHTVFPNNNYSILALEDDDTACEIKTDNDYAAAFVNAISVFSKNYKAAKDSLGVNGRTLNAARAFWSLVQAVASMIKTNDDLIGVAIANSTTGLSSPNANWAWIGDNQARYGWVNLVMK